VARRLISGAVKLPGRHTVADQQIGGVWSGRGDVYRKVALT